MHIRLVKNDAEQRTIVHITKDGTSYIVGSIPYGTVDFNAEFDDEEITDIVILGVSALLSSVSSALAIYELDLREIFNDE